MTKTALLAKYAGELAELFKVSEVHLVDAQVETKVTHASGNKCPRCWAFRAEVGAQELCARCTEAVT